MDLLLVLARPGRSSKTVVLHPKRPKNIFTAITANSHKQPAADAKLVGQLPPLPQPDEWFYWFSADQAGDQSPADQNCVSIDGKLRRYTEATLSNHPDGKHKDYVYVGKGNGRTEATGVACASATKKTE